MDKLLQNALESHGAALNIALLRLPDPRTDTLKRDPRVMALIDRVAPKPSHPASNLIATFTSKIAVIKGTFRVIIFILQIKDVIKAGNHIIKCYN